MASPLQPLSPYRLNVMSSPSPQKAGSESTTTTTTPDDSSSQSQSSSSPTRKSYQPSLPQSPSLSEFSLVQRQSHGRPNSDVHVQGLVKRFEHLDVRDRDAEFNERRRKDEAKLRRAEMAREEAESDVSKFREEVRALRRELEETKDRERVMGKRLEAVKDDHQLEKDQYSTQVALYEKEIRRSRKEAFKSSSTVLKLQEELKSTRNQLHVSHQTLDLEKQKLQRREQDTFNAQYQLVAVREEVEKLRVQLKVIEEERVALKNSLQQEEVARIAAEGLIALPILDDEFSSPKKTGPHLSPPRHDEDKENVPTALPSPQKKMRLAIETQDLKDELARERRWRLRADEMVEFLQLECKFGCCSCHRRQRLPRPQDLTRQATPPSMRTSIAPRPSMPIPNLEKNEDVIVDEMEIEPETEAEALHQASPQPSTTISPHQSFRQSKTVTTTIPVHFDTPVRRPTPITPENQTPLDDSISLPAQSSHSRPLSVGAKPLHRSTTSHLAPDQPYGDLTAARQPHQPQHQPPVIDPLNPGFDRAAALAMIEYRRGRAKSIAQGTTTPRRALIHGIVGRRDITR